MTYVLCENCQDSVSAVIADVNGGLCYKCRTNQLESKLADLLTLLKDILKWDGILPHSRTRIKQEIAKAEGK